MKSTAPSTPFKTNMIIGKEIELNGKTYKILPAYNKRNNCISLQNTESLLFLRHRAAKLIETSTDSKLDSFSFIPSECGDGFTLHCSNDDMENYNVCKTNEGNLIVDISLMEYVFRPITQKRLLFQENYINNDECKNLLYTGSTIDNRIKKAQFYTARALALSDLFSREEYYTLNTDVSKTSQDPLWHYVTKGICEGRRTNSDDQSALRAEAFVLLHMLCSYETCSFDSAYLSDLIEAGYLQAGLGAKLYQLLCSARIDILAHGTKEKPLKLSFDPAAKITSSTNTELGVDVRIEDTSFELEIKFRCDESGELEFKFFNKNLRKKDTKETVPLSTLFSSVEILKNGVSVKDFSQPFIARYRKITNFTLPVQSSDAIHIKATWHPCYHSMKTLLLILEAISESSLEI